MTALCCFHYRETGRKRSRQRIRVASGGAFQKGCGTELENIALAPVAIGLQIASGGTVCLPFANRSGNQAPRKKMDQKHEHETPG